MGTALLLAAPATMVLAVLVWRFADEGPGVVLLHAWLARAGVLIGLLVGMASIVFGVWGLRSAKRQCQHAGLALAGLLLGLAASAAWLIASIGLLNTTESLLRIHGQ
jgi:ABC-type phosphate transport system permease subunit